MKSKESNRKQRIEEAIRQWQKENKMEKKIAAKHIPKTIYTF